MSEVKKDTEISLEKEFDLRERRLKLIYKILYVVAIGTAVVLVSFAELTNELNPVYFGILSVLISFLISLLNFIFSEFRCIKIYGKIDESIKQEAEFRFSFIWNSLALSSSVALIFTVINLLIVEYIAFPVNIWFICIPMFIALSILIICSLVCKVKPKNKEIIKSITIPTICYCIFSLVQTVEVL